MVSSAVHLPGFSHGARRFGEPCKRIEEWGFDSIWLADGPTRNAIEPLPDMKQVANRIEAYNDAGASYQILNFGTRTQDESKIELFAREVLPSFT